MGKSAQVKQVLREAISHLEAGRVQRASELCKRALAMDPSSADAHHLRGAVALRAARRDAAIEAVAKAIELNPRKAEYHNTLGATCAEAGQLARAVHHFWRALSLEPNYIDAMRDLARALVQAGDRPEADRIAQEVAALDPQAAADPRTLCETGRRLAEAHQHARAVACFRRAVELKGDFIPARAWLVHALELDDKVPEAIVAAGEGWPVLERDARAGRRFRPPGRASGVGV